MGNQGLRPTPLAAKRTISTSRIERSGLAETALNHLAIPCFVKDTDLVYTHVNDAFCDFLGRKRAEIVGFTAFDIAPEEMALVYTDQDRKLMAEGGTQTYQSDVIGANGELRHVRFEKRRLLDENHILLGLTGTIIDITDHVHTESKLRAGRRLLHDALLTTVHAMAKALEMRDPYTAGHQVRVAQLAGRIAEAMGWDPDRVEGLQVAASVHDLGKLQTPAEILNRPGRLTDPEMALIRQHAQSGYDILADIPFPWPVAEIIRQHHERLDGSGYPRGLRDNEILPEAKILAVADVFEAITSHRPYRPGRGVETALEELKAGAGTRYDPAACNTLFTMVEMGEELWADAAH